ncbi:hypothetical protein [Collimonas fungivorans]|uniref:hypothetical protein n=1 Tax=Collimonas fungivorans TaxID=158899 RepID=UPI0011D1FCA6|nr:hypothetical protein [Collimonas fungivorans]
MTGIEAAAGTDAGRRQGFGKRACRCLSGFRLQAKTREIPSAPRNEGRFVWRFNGPAQSSEARKQQFASNPMRFPSLFTLPANSFCINSQERNSATQFPIIPYTNFLPRHRILCVTIVAAAMRAIEKWT